MRNLFHVPVFLDQVTLMIDDKVYERRVACKGDQSQDIPDITIREAIKIAFLAEEDGNSLKFPRQNNFKIDDNASIIFDTVTIEKLGKQGKPISRNGLDYRLEPGMGIIITKKLNNNNHSTITNDKIKLQNTAKK